MSDIRYFREGGSERTGLTRRLCFHAASPAEKMNFDFTLH